MHAKLLQVTFKDSGPSSILFFHYYRFTHFMKNLTYQILIVTFQLIWANALLMMMIKSSIKVKLSKSVLSMVLKKLMHLLNRLCLLPILFTHYICENQRT